MPHAEELGCVSELQSAIQIPTSTGSRQQLAIFEQTQDKAEVVRQMIENNHFSNC
jgi:hypothetical protein